MALYVDAELNARPEATNDGSGCVTHDLTTKWYRDPEGKNVMLHKTVNIPYSVFEALAALPSGERPGAYKQAIIDYFFVPKTPLPEPSAPSSLSTPAILAYIDEYEAWEADFNEANSNAETWANNAGNFVESLGNFEDYPYPFNLYSSE